MPRTPRLIIGSDGLLMDSITGTVISTSGPQGPQGDQGVQGIQGVKGDTGSQGIQGNPGADGAQGTQGPPGNDGAPGAQGQQGIQGVPGNDGAPGAQGNQGIQGVPGNDGAQGPPGPVVALDTLNAPTDITTLNATTALHGLMQKYPGGTSTFLRADGTFAAPTAAVGLTTVEINLGATERRSGTFTISGTGLSCGKAVLIQQAVGPYTGKGTQVDEVEMDQALVTASVTDPTTIRAYWKSQHQMRGCVKFNYLVSA